MQKSIAIIIFLFCIPSLAFNQEDKIKNWSLKGNIKNLQNTWIEDFNKDWITWSVINNRLDFKWYPNVNFTTSFGVRNQFMYGQLLQIYDTVDSDYFSNLAKDKGLFDLTHVFSTGSSYVLMSNIDRANIKFSKGKWDIRAGRQRVNWGIGLVWNPNDIFNTFDYFDFDYEERPGSDAIQLQFYPNYTSNIQLVGKLNNNEDITLAGMYKFNKWNYDIQFLSGVMESDIVIGGGWAGQIEGGGFRGEITWFADKEKISDTNGILIATIDGDYTFKNRIYAHIAMLYNSNGTTGKAGWGTFFLDQDISPKTLTLARYSIFSQIAYPVTPLLNADLSGIYNPTDHSIFIGPSLNISLTDNLNLFIISQIFIGDKNSEFGDYGSIFYIRIKNSF
ncbi:hypothetical protein ACFL6I_14695 [candidate division KSB1 bacterium]